MKDEDIEEMEAWLEKEVTKLIMALVKFNTLTHFHIFYKYLMQPHLAEDATLTPAMKEYIKKRSAPASGAAGEEGSTRRSNNDNLFSL